MTINLVIFFLIFEQVKWIFLRIIYTRGEKYEKNFKTIIFNRFVYSCFNS